MFLDLCNYLVGLYVKEIFDEKLFIVIGLENKEDCIYVLVWDLGEFGSYEERGEFVFIEDSVCFFFCGICVVCGGFFYFVVVLVYIDGYGEVV